MAPRHESGDAEEHFDIYRIDPAGDRCPCAAVDQAGDRDLRDVPDAACTKPLEPGHPFGGSRVEEVAGRRAVGCKASCACSQSKSIRFQRHLDELVRHSAMTSTSSSTLPGDTAQARSGTTTAREVDLQPSGSARMTRDRTVAVETEEHRERRGPRRSAARRRPRARPAARGQALEVNRCERLVEGGEPAGVNIPRPGRDKLLDHERAGTSAAGDRSAGAGLHDGGRSAARGVPRAGGGRDDARAGSSGFAQACSAPGFPPRASRSERASGDAPRTSRRDCGPTGASLICLSRRAREVAAVTARHRRSAAEVTTKAPGRRKTAATTWSDGPLADRPGRTRHHGRCRVRAPVAGRRFEIAARGSRWLQPRRPPHSPPPSGQSRFLADPRPTRSLPPTGAGPRGGSSAPPRR